MKRAQSQACWAILSSRIVFAPSFGALNLHSMFYVTVISLNVRNSPPLTHMDRNANFEDYHMGPTLPELFVTKLLASIPEILSLTFRGKISTLSVLATFPAMSLLTAMSLNQKLEK